jgi:hypothetical protein
MSTGMTPAAHLATTGKRSCRATRSSSLHDPSWNARDVFRAGSRCRSRDRQCVWGCASRAAFGDQISTYSFLQEGANNPKEDGCLSQRSPPILPSQSMMPTMGRCPSVVDAGVRVRSPALAISLSGLSEPSGRLARSRIFGTAGLSSGH